MKLGLSIFTILFCFVNMVIVTNTAQGTPVKPIELKLITSYAPTHVVSKDLLAPWGKMVEERTGGKVKCSVLAGELLAKDRDIYDAVVKGVGDIAWGHPPVARYPLARTWSIPYLFPTTGKQATRVIAELYKNNPILMGEWHEVKLLFVHGTTTLHLNTNRKPVRSLKDVKDLKIRVLPTSAVGQKTVKAIGAIPVGMSFADSYTALERGTIDGGIFGYDTIVAFKLDEVLRYHTVPGFWIAGGYLFMNKRKWESLSPDIQKIIEDINGVWGEHEGLAGAVFDKAEKAAEERVKGMKDHEIINLTPEEFVRWKDATNPIAEDWISEWEPKGIPMRRIIDEARRLSEKYSK